MSTRLEKIDRAGLAVVRARVLQTLKDLETELGITFTSDPGRYATDTGELTLKFAVNAADGSKRTPSEIDFERFCVGYGLAKTDLGRTFVAQGKSYKVSGMMPSSRRYPILGTLPNGKTFKFTAAAVLQGFKIAEDPPASKPKPAAPSLPPIFASVQELPPTPSEPEPTAPEPERTFVAPPRPAALSEAAKAMQDRLFG